MALPKHLMKGYSYVITSLIDIKAYFINLKGRVTEEGRQKESSIYWFPPNGHDRLDLGQG